MSATDRLSLSGDLFRLATSGPSHRATPLRSLLIASVLVFGTVTGGTTAEAADGNIYLYEHINYNWGGGIVGFSGDTNCHCWWTYNNGVGLNDTATSVFNNGYAWRNEVKSDWYLGGALVALTGPGSMIPYLYNNDLNSSHFWYP